MRLFAFLFILGMFALPAVAADIDYVAIARNCSMIDGSMSNATEDGKNEALTKAKTICAKGVFQLLDRTDFQANENLITANAILNSILTDESISSKTAIALSQAIQAKAQLSGPSAPSGPDTLGAGCRKIDRRDASGRVIGGFELRNALETCAKNMDIYLSDKDFYENPRIPRQADVRRLDRTFSHATSEELANLIEEKKATLRTQRNDISNRRFVKRCFNQTGTRPTYQNALNSVFDTCRLRASNTPGTVETNKPASFSYTLNRDGDDSIAVQSAFRGGRTVGDVILSVNADYERNNQQKKEQANLKTGLGLSYVLAPSSEAALRRFNENPSPEALERFLNGFYSVELEFDVDYNRQGLFGDPTSTACGLDPTQLFCGRQNLESLRLTGSAAPYLPFLSGRLASSNDVENSWPWAISPVGQVFFDTALNDDVITPDGVTVTGDVFGLKGGFTAAITPGYLRNRIELSVSGHIIHALSRDAGRVSMDDAFNFEKTSRQFSASLQYALSDGAFVGQSSGNNIIPIISFTYTNGSDSLKGRRSQDTLVIGLGLEY